MSYCRFGSDNGKSDVYVIATGTHWEIYVRGDKPECPYNGEVYRRGTVRATLRRLYFLRKKGLHIPDCAIARLLREEKGE